MYSDWMVWILPLVAFVWLGILSYLAWKQKNFLKSLFPKSGERDIRKKFEEVLQFEGKLDDLSKESLSSISRVELVRFNPYGDTGGDQSFSVALLDSLGNGLVLTSLHSRSGTRVFAKPVVKGQAGKYKFSAEEEKVVEKALTV